MKIGYARISTKEQKLEPQIDKLIENGCEKIYSDVASGVKEHRKGLNNLLEFTRINDTIVIVRLDRLGRSLKELINLINLFEEKQISLISLSENIDTTTASGKLIFNIFGALADFERNLIVERTKAGLESARARGRFGGRKKSLKKADIEHIFILYNSKKFIVNDIAKKFNISRATLYNYIHEYKSIIVKTN